MFRKNTEQDFWRRVDCRSPDECWPWIGKFYGDSDYGFIGIAGKVWTAHAYAYTVSVGQIPPGHDVHHTCRNRSCCNPRHLETKARTEHNREEGHCVAVEVARTSCPYGHAYDETNTYVFRGKRQCRTCARERAAARRAREKREKAA